MSVYDIHFTDYAESDLFHIIEYITSKQGARAANKRLLEFENAVLSLSEMPERGHQPHELYGVIGCKQLEIIVQNTRIIYEIRGTVVYLIAILDGRQNVRMHLQKRMTRVNIH